MNHEQWEEMNATPWEWKQYDCVQETWCLTLPHVDAEVWFWEREDRWYASMDVDGGLSCYANEKEVFLDSRERAQEFLRAAYLRWMKGGILERDTK